MLIHWIFGLFRTAGWRTLATVGAILSGLLAALLAAPAIAVSMETALLTWLLCSGLLIVWAVDNAGRD